MTPSADRYSWLDRVLHRIAFSSPAIQMTAADMEASLYGRRFRGIAIDRPIFVTSLPRAGTTLLLELLSRVPGVATYSYRDMPFVLAPLLWQQLSGGFRKPAALQERAHGDGMQVGFDSPEAFEEVVWRAYWPEKFQRSGIALWSEGDEAEGFREAFVSQMQRIIAVRAGASAGELRYLSKNNANIARIRLIRRLVPDAVLLVPFRRPVEQATSLLRQHLRFSQIHRQDAFARRYMESIGHLEFGELHRPIRFDGVEEARTHYQPETLDYWMAYWTLAFEHLLQQQDTIVLVSYERLCEAGAPGLQAVARRVGIPGEHMHAAAGPELRVPGGQVPSGSGVDEGLMRAADAVHARLLERCILQP